MKINQLRYFACVSKHLSFSKAAEELYVTQPAISTAIRDLEKEFGVTLVRRTSYGIVLTPEGSQFAELATNLLANVQHVEETMCDIGNNRNLVRVGLPPMIGSFWFPELYKGLKKQYPNVILETVEHGTLDLLEQLSSELLDVIIVPTNFDIPEDFSVIPLRQSETVFCVAKGHPLSGERTVSIAQIKDEPLVMFNRGFFQSNFVEQLYRKHGVKPNVVYYTDQFYTVYKHIALNNASGFMLRDGAILFDDIVPISLETPALTDISIVTKKAHTLFKAPLNFIDFIQKMSSHPDTH